MADGRTILLLGAGGFAGSHFREAAEQAGVRTVAASRSGGAGPACDLLDSPSLRRVLADVAPEVVVNLAGSASVAASWDRPEDAFAVNATGVLNLLEAVVAAAPEAYVLCVSSAEVYGEAPAERLPFAEDLAPAPVTPYGAAKAAMEVLCGQYARSRGLRIGVVRSFNLIGPGQAQQFAVSGLAKQVAEAEAAGAERAVLDVGNPAAARDFIDVRDGARALLGLAERELAGVFNLCSGEAVPLRRLIDHLAAATPLPLEIRDAPELARPADPLVVFGAPGRLREATGWKPEIPLERSIADVLGWWRGRLAGTGVAHA